MNRWLVILVLLSIPAFAGDWQKELSKPQPGKFALPRASTATYKFGWSALPAATATIDTTRPKPEFVVLDVTLKTTGAARSMFQLDAQHHAVAHSASLQPQSMTQSEQYSDETIKTQLAFDSAGVTRQRTSNVGTAGKGKAKNFKFTPLYDLNSAFLWLRSQPLVVGDKYNLVLYASTDPFLVEFTVLAGEKLKVAEQQYKALKIDVKLKRLNKQLEILPYKKCKRATGWISDDADRILLKAESDLFIGSVWVELKSITFADK